MVNRLLNIDNFTDLLLDAVCLVDVQGRFVFASSACERIFGFTPEEMFGKPMIDMVAPEDRERTLQAAQAVMAGQPQTNFENRYVRKDGTVAHIMWSASWSEADQLRVAIARDISVRKHAEAMRAALYAISEAAHTADDMPALFQSIHHVIAGLLPTSGLAVALCDGADGALRFAYHADERGPVSDEPLPPAQCVDVLAHDEPRLLAAGQGGASAPWLAMPLNTAQAPIGVVMLKAPHAMADSGQYKDLLTFVSTQIATAIDRKRLHSQLQHMAQHDELTLLPNRRLFHDRLETALARCQRQQTKLSLLFIDLDKFKLVNDQFGHLAGDRLLREVALRLKACVREVDTVARMGGDEFVVLLEDVALADNALLVRDKIDRALTPPVALGDGASVKISASIGIAHYPDDGSDMLRLLRHADQAMYAAKQ